MELVLVVKAMVLPMVQLGQGVHLLMTSLVWRMRFRRMGVGSVVSSRCVVYSASRLVIGTNVRVNDFVHIWAGGGVDIGDDTLIAAHCVITSQSHDVRALAEGKLYRETNVAAPVVVGRNVWLGSGVIVLPGVSIGDNAVVAAGAVVTRDIPPGVLAMGVPARVVKSLGPGVTDGVC